MTLAWRRFFESQWLRSGGFEDLLYAALLASNTGDATLAEVASATDENRIELSNLKALVQAGIAESLQQEIEDLRNQLSGLNAQIQAVRGEDTQAIVGALTTDQVPEGLTRQYFTVARARASVSASGSISYNVGTGVFSYTAGSSATYNVGTSGNTIPLLDGINTWSNTQTFTVAPVFTAQAGTRTALGLANSAIIATGTSGATIPLNNGANTWSSAQTFTLAPIFTDAAGTRSALGLVIGTNVQAWDADLDSIASFAGTGTGGLIYRSAANTWGAVTISANLGFAAGVLGSALGTAATQNTGTSGATVPLLNGANTWSAAQIWTSFAQFQRPPRITALTVASLNSTYAPASYSDGVAIVTDALAPVTGNIVAGGGAVRCVVTSDGTNWRVG
jgi:hypothetical protein